MLERRSPSIREGGSTRKGDRKILLDELVVDTADGVCDIVRGRAIEGVLLAGGDGVPRTQRTSKRLSVRGGSSYETDSRINNDVRRGSPGSPHLHHRASGRPNLLAVQIYLLAAGALQAHEHETSRVVIVIDTTNGQLIADKVAKGRRQIRVPREHSPRPESRTQHDDFMSIDFQDDVIDELLVAHKQQDYNGNWSLDFGFVELAVLNTKEAALYDGIMPTSWCELKARRSQIRS